MLQVVTVGIAAAVVILFLLPGEDTPVRRPVVEVRHSETHSTAPAMGPVSYADAVANAAPAVVNIYTRKTVTERVSPFFDDPFLGRLFGEPRQHTQSSLGSGVIIDAKGYILTNNHVIADADAIEVLVRGGRIFSATIVGSDPETDLAVLHIKGQDLPTITVGSSAHLRVGDVVLAIGNPFGVGQTVTMGIVGATGRNHLGINTFEDFIQTDAAINPGNSGGALINAFGELIGVNTAIVSRSGGSHGIGFAIPIDLARGVMTEIIENGRVVRGWLGVKAQVLTPQIAESLGLEDARGALIAGVAKDGPADRAGIRPGDVITVLDGVPVEDAVSAMNNIARRKPGEDIEIEGIHRGEAFKTQAKITERPSNP